MSQVGKILEKMKGKISGAVAGGGSLPAGNYIGVITKGAIATSDKGDAVNVVFSVKVTEGECKNRTTQVRQNIVKNDGDPNETGVSIVKGALIQMFGKDEAGVNDGSTWEKLVARSAGFIVKFKLTAREGTEYMNSSIQAVLEKQKGAGAPADSDDDDDQIPGLAAPKKGKKAPAKEEEEEEEEGDDKAKEEEEEEASPREAVEAHVAALDRAGLKAFIKEHSLDVKVFKSTSDDDLRAKIMDAVPQ